MFLKVHSITSTPEFRLYGFRHFKVVLQLSSRLLTAEARVRAEVSPCVTCGVKVALKQIFSEYFWFPLSTSLSSALKDNLYSEICFEG